MDERFLSNVQEDISPCGGSIDLDNSAESALRFLRVPLLSLHAFFAGFQKFKDFTLQIGNQLYVLSYDLPAPLARASLKIGECCLRETIVLANVSKPLITVSRLTTPGHLMIAVRSTKGGAGKAGGAFGVWYKLFDAMWDTVRMAQYEGVPFKWASPDPIWQTIHPPMGEGWQYVHPPEKQPYIVWITRLACYCQKHGKGIDYVNEVSSLIWGNHAEHWPAHVKERFNRIDGLDYDEAIKYIRENPEEIDAFWQENSKVQVQAGHGGVPLMIFNGEPFFGGDRFNPFYWRLRQNGLTRRQKPRPPLTVKPLRWPDGE